LEKDYFPGEKGEREAGKVEMEAINERPLRAIVVGAGSIGANHVRIYNEMPEVELAGVVEPDPATAARISRVYHVPVYLTLEALLAEGRRVDLASVAVPATRHYAIASHLLEARVNVLVEKPITTNLAEGQRLARLALENNCLFTVGHIERFNPAIKELKRRLDAGQFGQIFMVRAERQGHFPTRKQDTGVTIDLAIHDLDIFNWLLGESPVSVYGQTIGGIYSDHDDLVCGLLRFASGKVASLNVNWVTPHKVRKISLTGSLGMVEVNYLTQELIFYRNSRYPAGAYTNLKVLVGHNEGEVIHFPVNSEEPLKAELQNVVNACLGKEPLQVPAQAGLEALYLAQLLIESGREQQLKMVEPF
jgi:predicted dehydrogenase